jgi:hypothetical protein
MRDTNANRPSSAYYLLASGLLVVAYVGLYYASVHRRTGVACQYYAFDWHGTRYFLDDSQFYPIDWLDRQLGVSEWVKLRRVGIAQHAYHEMSSTRSSGAGNR